MATAAKPLTGWYPNFAADKNFKKFLVGMLFLEKSLLS